MLLFTVSVKLHFCSSLSDCWCFRVFDRTSDLIVALQKNLTSFHQKNTLSLRKKARSDEMWNWCLLISSVCCCLFLSSDWKIHLSLELLRGRRRLNEVGGKKWRDLWKKWQKINWHGKQKSKACSFYQTIIENTTLRKI